MDLHFRDKFFGMGASAILNEAGEAAGRLDVHGMARTRVDVYGADGELRYIGKLAPFLLWWKVTTSAKEELGLLTLRAAVLKKKFRYETGGRGVYMIEAPAFTKEFNITLDGRVVAIFSKTNAFWSSSDAYVLHNESALDSYELAAVVMGINALLQD